MAKSAAEIAQAGYAHPEVLVDTQWVADHLGDPKVKIVEVDVDTAAYDTGHLKGAIGLDWRKDLQARPIRDLLPKQELEALLSPKAPSAGATSRAPQTSPGLRRSARTAPSSRPTS